MTDELVFYTNPMSRGRIVRWMLEEVGRPYRTDVLEYATTMKAPEYLAINPMGKVPALRHGEAVVTECAAICAYLADAFPQADLAPPPGDPNRGPYYRWMFFAPSCMEPVITDKAFNRPPVAPSTVGYGDFDDVMDTVSAAVSNIEYIAGNHFTAADLILGGTLSYGMMFGLIPKRDEFVVYAGRMTSRDAYKRSRAREEELAAQIEAEEKEG